MATIKAFPFKTRPNAPQTIEVGNSTFGSVQLPKYGCLTVGESELINEILRRLTDDKDNTPLNELQIEVATLALQRIDKEWTLENTREAANDPDSPLRFGLIEEIYEFFFIHERSRWQPKAQLLRVVGSDGYKVARSYAKENQAVVAVLPAVKDTWFVFKTRKDVPEDLEVKDAYDGSVASVSAEPLDSHPVGKK